MDEEETLRRVFLVLDEPRHGMFVVVSWVGMQVYESEGR
jgi:hypothetical protein